jgi:acyl-CoA synthetase (AMP-forming)/AMP-acid ligase II
MKTLNEALDRAAGFADCGLRILDRRERQTWLDWAEVRRRSTIVAGGLRAQGIGRGEIVGLFYLTGEEFFAAFFGVLMAGAVPAPLYPPVRLGRLAEYQIHTSRMLQAAGVRNALIDGRLRRVLGLALSQAGCRGYTQAELPKGSEVATTVASDELGLVQFSSGTTRDPKPVALTHEALMAQAKTLNNFWPDTDEKRHSGVSWLPLYHDMGLIGCVFTVLERPSTLTLIPPELFVARPVVWLRALSKFRATVSPAPNFAFSLCVEKVRDADLQDLDLSQWRAALCGAEAVVPAVLRRFADRFAGCGFRPEALTPVYGLSEAALAVTFSELGEPFTTRSMSRQQSGNAPRHERELVSVGRPLPGFEIQVRDELGAMLADEEEGRIWIRGPSLMKGYLNQPQATAAVLKDGWLDTGDRGFLYDGELYVSGRAKDVLIVRGANHAPEEIEATVTELESVRTGCAAAVGYLPEDADREQVWLFVERNRDLSDREREAVIAACKHRVLAHIGIAVDRVEVLDPGILPRTSSGKIRRQRALELFLAGEWPPSDAANSSSNVKKKGLETGEQSRVNREPDAS